MKIAHVCVAGEQPLLATTGGAVQRRILELSRQQVREGHDVVAYSANREAGSAVVDGVRLRNVRCRLPMPYLHAEYLLRLLIALLRSPRPDVLNFHGQPEGVVLAKIVRCPSVLFYDFFRFRGFPQWSAGWRLYRRILGGFDRLIPCSDFCRRESTSYWRLDDGRVNTVYNGVDLGQFQPDPGAGKVIRERLGLTSPVILYVGRVTEQKGTDILLAGFERIAASGVAASLVIAGPIGKFGAGVSVEADAWTDRIRRSGGIYLGPVQEAELAAVYNCAAVFVMPTRVDEMFGMAAVEAQACGVPVIASDIGGLRETVPPASGGRVPPDDPEALAERIIVLLGDEGRRNEASLNARRSAARFAWPTIAARLMSVYEEMGVGA